MINSKWIKEYFISVTPKLEWTESELDLASKLLEKIYYSESNFIAVVPDNNDTMLRESVIGRIEKLLEIVIQSYVRSLRVPIENNSYIKSESANNASNVVLESKLEPKVDLNYSDFEELLSLPVIGKTLAQRILDYRELNSFETIEDLLMVEGIGEANFGKIKRMLTVSKPLETPIILTTSIFELLENPTVENYLNYLTLPDISVNFNGEIINDSKKKIISELKRASRYFSSKNTTEANFKRSIFSTTSEVSEDVRQRSLLAEIENNSITDQGMQGGLIFDSQYLSFVTELVKNATSKINIIMFFLRYDENENYPTHRLVQEVIKAKSRGVEVKVILDADSKEGSIFNSRIINQKVYDLFKSKKVEIVFDSPEVPTHTKLVIIDDMYIVVGTHNWTAGSFYAYDDTSVFIKSSKVALNYRDDFDQRFLSLSNSVDESIEAPIS